MTLSGAIRSVVLTTLIAVPVLADFTYEQTTQVTGGALLSMMKFAGAFSKDSHKLTQPMAETVSVKGNRMIRKSADTATIIDVDRETITTVDFAKRTYSVMTFEELKQQMAEMQERMRTKGQEQPNFDVKVKDTGKTKTINGTDTHEVVTTMIMSGVDAKSGSRGAMNIANDAWIAPNVSGYEEARDLHKRMAEKLGWELGQNALLNRPDVAKAMAEVYKSGSKLDGIPLASYIRMGADIQAPPDGSQAAASTPPPAASNGSSNGDSSASSALGNVLAGRFGLGGRKKKDNGGGDSGADPNSTGSLIEMSTLVNNYNSATVEEALFQIPAGFSKVEARKPGR